MRILKQNTEISISVLMTSAENHIDGALGLSSFTARASKNGSAFQVAAINVTEIGNGWYSVGLTEGLTDTLGDLLLHITVDGADPTDILMVVSNELSEIATKVDELYTIAGLKNGTPSTASTASRVAGGINIQITGDGITSTTMTRQ